MVNAKKLSDTWNGWQISGDPENFKDLGIMTYCICSGIIATKFFKTGIVGVSCEDLIQSTFLLLIEKITDGRLYYDAEKGNPFNLITTASINGCINILDKHKRKQNNFNTMLVSLKNMYKINKDINDNDEED